MQIKKSENYTVQKYSCIELDVYIWRLQGLIKNDVITESSTGHLF